MRSLKIYLVLAALLMTSNLLSSMYSRYLEGEKKSVADQALYDKQAQENAAAEEAAAQEDAERAKRWYCTITSKCVVVVRKEDQYEIRTSRYNPPSRGERTRYKTSQGTVTYDDNNCYFTFSKSKYEVVGDEGSCACVYRRPKEPNT